MAHSDRFPESFLELPADYPLWHFLTTPRGSSGGWPGPSRRAAVVVQCGPAAQWPRPTALDQLCNRLPAGASDSPELARRPRGVRGTRRLPGAERRPRWAGVAGPRPARTTPPAEQRDATARWLLLKRPQDQAGSTDSRGRRSWPRRAAARTVVRATAPGRIGPEAASLRRGAGALRRRQRAGSGGGWCASLLRSHRREFPASAGLETKPPG
jgi:hypothetical protein